MQSDVVLKDDYFFRTTFDAMAIPHEICIAQSFTTHAILRTNLPQPYPARVFSRVTLRRNTAKLAEIGKKGVFK